MTPRYESWRRTDLRAGGSAPRGMLVGFLALLLMAAPAWAAPGAPAAGGPGAARKAPAKPPTDPVVSGEAAILVDADTGAVLFRKNADVPRPMASLTKMMTALLVIESGRLGETVTVSKRAAETMYSSLHLKPGEKLTLHDLLVGILLRSANDACVAAAEHLDGSVERFVARMNDRALDLGLRNTWFVNPHGLHDPDHFSTAEDLATLARAAMRSPVFREIVASKRRVIQRMDPKGDRLIYSRSRILWRMPGADGIKTGYTRQAGNCFVGSATRDGWRLISVVLASPQVYPDTEALLRFGFERHRRHLLARSGQVLGRVPVRGGAAPWVPAAAAADLYCVRRVDRNRGVLPVIQAAEAQAPVASKAALGKVVFWEGNERLGEVGLVAADAVEQSPLGAAAALAGSIHSAPLPWMFVVVGLVFLGYGTSSKAALRRWRRFAQASRRVDPRRKSYH